MTVKIKNRVCPGCGGELEIADTAFRFLWSVGESVCMSCRHPVRGVAPEVFSLAEEYERTIGFNYWDPQSNPNIERRRCADRCVLCKIIEWIRERKEKL